MLRIALLILAAATLGFSAAAEALVRVGDIWRYHKAHDVRSLAPPGWQFPQFDDSAWNAAPTGYVFDDPQWHPRLRAGARRGYVNVRKKFRIQDLSQIKSLILRVEFERSFVAYLNGAEVARAPGAGGLRDALQADVARGFPASPAGQFDLSRFLPLLTSGENVLALEGPFSREASEAVPLTAVLLANFVRGPVVQNVTTGSVQLIWRTTNPGTTLLEFGTTTNLGNRQAEAAPVTEHVCSLSNLLSGQKYFYRASSATTAGLIQSGVEIFYTFKPSGPVQFVVLGDSGQGTSAQFAIAEVIRRQNPDLVLHCGDLVYQGFNDRTVDWRFFNYYQAHMATTPYYMVVGNHDLNCCLGDGEPDYNPTNWVFNATNFQNSFFLPTNSVTGTKHFYSFDAGDAHFVALYNPWFADYVFQRASDQFQWLTSDLAQSSKPWKFIFMHMPLATSGGHFGRDDDANFLNDSSELMSLLLPLAARYEVQLIMGGHDHNFERFAPTNGVHHFVTGGGGGAVYGMKQRHPASVQFWATNHCTKVSVSGDTALVEALDLHGAVFDSFVIHRAATPDQLFESTWHSPRMPGGSANDGDGNIPGQRFDFAGKPLLARAGNASNLGRVYVNNDQSDLYIGFENVMTYDDQTIYLFIESSRQPGVTNLAGLGNGIIDPRREGADGLDFLENVGFTNFVPSIGCILGDEYGDGQFRNFKRSAARLNTGQGGFHLDRALSNVAGFRLQQFNRSPQIDVMPDESNADLIEIAIPFKALGNIRPGEVVKLGAIVAGGDFNPEAQTQAVDTGYLGVSLSGDGHGRIVLGAVRVRLATAPK